MGFTTETFMFIFLPVTILLCVCVPGKLLNWCALLLSAAFYLSAGMETAVVFAAFILISYIFGYLIEKAKKYNRALMVCAVGVAVLFLTYYKYLVFLRDNINQLSGGALHLTFSPATAAPLGISFLVFSAISYFSDVYAGGAADSLPNVALYIAFFPKVLSGPIARWKEFAPQIASAHSKRNLVGGINRIILGYVKKAVVADSLGLTIAEFNNRLPAGVDAPSYWLNALFYMFQLYYDFSGYSDIAIGLGMLFGFELPENFRQPYTSASITEFWRRWHISLGAWFREYVYIPLGGNRRGNVYAHLFVVFLLTGIWHGANWTFVLWGLLHGFFVILERALNRSGKLDKIPAACRWPVTMLVVYFSWILFMSPSIQDAVAYLSCMFRGSGAESVNFTWRYFLTAKAAALLGIAAVGAGLGRFRKPVRLPFLVKEAAYLALLLLSVLFVVNSSYSPFLYFQF